MAWCQCGSFSAARVDLGIGEKAEDGMEVSDTKAYLGLGLTMPTRDRVTIGWAVATGGATAGAAEGAATGAAEGAEE